MSNSPDELENVQKNQKQVGSAESNPSTTEPADKLREEAAEDVDEDEESSEPAWFLSFFGKVASERRGGITSKYQLPALLPFKKYEALS